MVSLPGFRELDLRVLGYRAKGFKNPNKTLNPTFRGALYNRSPGVSRHGLALGAHLRLGGTGHWTPGELRFMVWGFRV